jgi:hypothetical protein
VTTLDGWTHDGRRPRRRRSVTFGRPGIVQVVRRQGEHDDVELTVARLQGAEEAFRRPA